MNWLNNIFGWTWNKFKINDEVLIKRQLNNLSELFPEPKTYRIHDIFYDSGYKLTSTHMSGVESCRTHGMFYDCDLISTEEYFGEKSK